MLYFLKRKWITIFCYGLIELCFSIQNMLLKGGGVSIYDLVFHALCLVPTSLDSRKLSLDVSTLEHRSGSSNIKRGRGPNDEIQYVDNLLFVKIKNFLTFLCVWQDLHAVQQRALQASPVSFYLPMHCWPFWFW